MPNIYLVKYLSNHGVIWWGESLNKECAEALVELLTAEGAEPTLVSLKIPAKKLISFASTPQAVLALG